jgi:ribonuclease E
MLDQDETTPAPTDGPTSEPTAAPAKRASRPRKAAAKTAAPAPDAAAPDAPAVDAPAVDAPPLDVPPLDAPAKNAAPRKSTRKAAAPAVAPAVAPVVVAEPAPEPVVAEAVDSTPAKAAKRAPRKRAGQAPAAPDPLAEPTLAVPVEVVSSDTGADTPAPAGRRRRKAVPASAELAGAAGAPSSASDAAAPALAAPSVLFVAPSAPSAAPAVSRRRPRKATAAEGPPESALPPHAGAELEPTVDDPSLAAEDELDDELESELVSELDTDELRDAAAEQATGARRRRRRGRRGRGRQSESGDTGDAEDPEDTDEADEAVAATGGEDDSELGEESGGGASTRRRRRRRSGGSGAGAGDGRDPDADDPPNTVVHVRERRGNSGGSSGSGTATHSDDDDGVRGVKGSTRLEAKRQRRRDGRDSGRRRPSILSEAEFLARRESVDRVMAVRELGDRTQIAVLEDNVLVEHYVTRASATSYVGNVYLGRVQNVLPSMEAAFVDIGKGRNGVLYAGEVNWDAAGLDGKSRAIENAMRGGDTVLVQVTKDPIGHKGARLTSQISLPGRFLVYVPGGGMTGISRKLPDTERQRLKAILKKIVPEDAGVIIRTAAEGASEEELTHDVERLKAEWESISAQAESSAQKKGGPALVHGEPDLAIRVVRDVFNEDFSRLVVQGEQAWNTISGYLGDIAPELAARASRHTADTDLFHDLRVDEGLAKALDRKVYLPSGGSLVIDRTEAMTVVDVNTGKFVGSGGNLEQTVTRNNLEAAEEIVRQLRLRDVGGIVVIDFIDMVLESNRDLVLRRLTECLGRDRTKHQVAEVTSLGLVQMTRKRVGEGLIEAFSEPCEVCRGRGVIIHSEPVDQGEPHEFAEEDRQPRKRGGRRGGASKASVDEVDPAIEEERRRTAAMAMAAIHRAAAAEGDELSVELTDALAQATSALVGTDLIEPGSPQAPAEFDAQPDVEPDVEADVEADLQPDIEPDVEAESEALAVAESETPTTSSPDDGRTEPASERYPDSITDATYEPAPAPAAPRRRRRAASRPAGPPVAAS